MAYLPHIGVVETFGPPPLTVSDLDADRAVHPGDRDGTAGDDQTATARWAK